MKFDYLLVGLGNPGARYHRTRHNSGFILIDRLAQLHGIGITTSKYQSLVGQGMICGRRCLLAQPQTYMNRSGRAVRRILAYNTTPLHNLLVIHDDLDLPLGRVRIRAGGGAGGHRGVNSIIMDLGDEDFLRVKIGIGRPPSGTEAEDYVLRKFSPAESQGLKKALEMSVQGLETVLRDGPEKAMNSINSMRC